MSGRPTILVLAVALVASVGLAGCMDRADEPAQEDVSDDESALEESSTREQFGGPSEDDGGDGSLASGLSKLAPGTVLGGLILASRRRP